MHILKKRKTKKNKLEKRIELRILVKYEGIYIYKVYVPTKKEKKSLERPTLDLTKKKRLITNKEKKKELISINQNPLNKKQHNAKERTSTTLNNPKILKLDIDKQIIPLNIIFNLLTIDNDTHTATETSINKSDYNDTDEATESLLNITIK